MNAYRPTTVDELTQTAHHLRDTGYPTAAGYLDDAAEELAELRTREAEMTKQHSISYRPEGAVPIYRLVGPWKDTP